MIADRPAAHPRLLPCFTFHAHYTDDNDDDAPDPMATLGTARIDFPVLITEVRAIPRCKDWGAKVIWLSESLWDTLARDEGLASNVNAFSALLKEDAECFGLAQYVIPELRDVGDASVLSRPRNSLQQRLLDDLRDTRDERNRDQDQPLPKATEYEEEKDILYGAELHRASLMLHHSGMFTAEEEREIRAWLAQCPACLRKPVLPEIGTPSGAETPSERQ